MKRGKPPVSQMKVRLSPPLKAWLERQAESNCRTLNGEVVFRLEVARLAIEQNYRQIGGAPAAGQEA